MTTDVTTVSFPQALEVLRCPASQTRRGDHVAFVSPEAGDDEHVPGRGERIEATIRTAGQLQVLRAPAASIRRGDQVALLETDDTDGKGVAGAVTAVRAGADPTVALVVANRVHFVPADHDVVIIREATT